MRRLGMREEKLINLTRRIMSMKTIKRVQFTSQSIECLGLKGSRQYLLRCKVLIQSCIISGNFFEWRCMYVPFPEYVTGIVISFDYPRLQWCVLSFLTHFPVQFVVRWTEGVQKWRQPGCGMPQDERWNVTWHASVGHALCSCVRAQFQSSPRGSLFPRMVEMCF